MLHPVAYYLLALLLVILCGGAWLSTFVTLPGNWIIAGLAAVFTLLFLETPEHSRGMTWATVLVLVGLAVVGEILEFVAGAAGAAKQGASRRGLALSIVGAMVGSFAGLFVGVPIPLVGPLVVAVLGGAAGAFIGAYLGEAWKGREQEDRIAIGRGAFVGRLWGTAAKLVVGAIMLVIVVWDAFL